MHESLGGVLEGVPSMNGYNFTDRVRKVLQLAREHASKHGHDWVTPEHILLGVLIEADGVAGALLANLEVDSDSLRFALESSMKDGKPSNTGPDLPYTGKAKKVLELAMSEARQLEHSYVGTEHLVLGVLCAKSSPAAKALYDVGVTLERAREEAVRLLGAEQPYEPGDTYHAPDHLFCGAVARLALVVAILALAVAVVALVVAVVARPR
jgi:ATP-dependent Clp protease ATP-binding subunit ClpC